MLSSLCMTSARAKTQGRDVSSTRAWDMSWRICRQSEVTSLEAIEETCSRHCAAKTRVAASFDSVDVDVVNIADVDVVEDDVPNDACESLSSFKSAPKMPKAWLASFHASLHSKVFMLAKTTSMNLQPTKRQCIRVLPRSPDSFGNDQMQASCSNESLATVSRPCCGGKHWWHNVCLTKRSRSSGSPSNNSPKFVGEPSELPFFESFKSIFNRVHMASMVLLRIFVGRISAEAGSNKRRSFGVNLFRHTPSVKRLRSASRARPSPPPSLHLAIFAAIQSKVVPVMRPVFKSSSAAPSLRSCNSFGKRRSMVSRKTMETWKEVPRGSNFRQTGQHIVGSDFIATSKHALSKECPHGVVTGSKRGLAKQMTQVRDSSISVLQFDPAAAPAAFAAVLPVLLAAAVASTELLLEAAREDFLLFTFVVVVVVVTAPVVAALPTAMPVDTGGTLPADADEGEFPAKAPAEDEAAAPVPTKAGAEAPAGLDMLQFCLQM
mmetsp:Transcript_54656/g.116789  ORF Transcript_54656/g.116789 Transcript_54656/m.116789 type:complete len:492 (-) Transcript_54656:237-1712(-)